MADLHVMLDREASNEEVQAVEEVLRSAAIDAEVTAGVIQLSAADQPWVGYITGASVLWIAGKFTGAMVEKAGEDAWEAYRADGWKGLRTFLTSMGQAREGRDGHMIVKSSGTADVVLYEELPDEALRALGKLDWSQITNGQLNWRDDRGEWLWQPPREDQRAAPK